MKNRNFFESFHHAFEGLTAIFREERNIKFDAFASVIVVICAFAFHLDKWEKCVVFFLCALVLTTEGVNSAIERVVDLASPDIHPLAKDAKDFAAAAVLIAAISSAIIGLYIFIPYGLEILK